MAYEQPRVQINQEFTQAATATTQPLPALIIGPQYDLFRYDVAAEKASTSVSLLGSNAYDPDADTTYDWPSKETGSVVDQDYTKVYLERVEATYFPEIGSPSTANQKVASYGTTGNQMQFTGATVLKTNTAYDRTAAYFKDRDVAVGDKVTIYNTDAPTVPVQTSTIKRLLANPVASSIGTPYADDVYATTATNWIEANKDVGVVVDTIEPVWFSLTGAAAPYTAIMNPGAVYVGHAGIKQDTLIVTCTTGATGPTATDSKWTIHSMATAFSNKTNQSPGATGVLLLDDTDGNSAAIKFGVGSDVIYTAGDQFIVYLGAVAVPVAGGVYAWAAEVKDTSTFIGHGTTYTASYTITCLTGVTLSSGAGFSDSRWSIAGAVTVASVTPTETGVLVVDDTDGNSLDLQFLLTDPELEFFAGETLDLEVAAMMHDTPVEVNPTTTGTYTGDIDDTYHIIVERGGPFYDGTNADTCARVKVLSANGDSSLAANITISTWMDLGTKGAQFRFTSNLIPSYVLGMHAGDTWYIDVVAASDGAINIIEITDKLSAASLAAMTATKAVVELRLTKTSVEIPEIKDLMTEAVNWETTADDITIKAGIEITDPLLANGEDLISIPVWSGRVYVTHRDLLPTYTISVGSVTEASEVEGLLGTVDPDNPLAQGTYNAALNSAGEIVYFVGVASNDEAGYNAALEIAKKKNTYYNLVPMSFDVGIQDAVIGHVESMRSSENAKWRIAWISKPLVTSETLTLKDETEDIDVTEWMATVTDDDTIAGDQFKLVTASDAFFIRDGVRVGDKVLINFRIDHNGAVVYDSYSIAEIRTETELVLDTSLDAAINSPVKIQILREYTEQEQIDAMSPGHSEIFVRCVFPPTYDYDGVEYDGYFLAASLAGQASGVEPHQGLTNSELDPAMELPLSVNTFTEAQLNELAEKGFWIVTQQELGSTPYTRHQLTTKTTSVNEQEHSIIANFDSICKGLQTILEPYIGVYNVNPLNVLKVRSAIDNYMRSMQTDTYTETAGNQVISYEIVSVAQDTVRKDKITAKLTAVLPAPMNNITVTIVI